MFIVKRSPENPILTPRREDPWEAVATFNPSPIKTKSGVRIFYRALSNPDALVSPYAGHSTIGAADSEDGAHFHSRRQVLMPHEPYDAFGCEDPRATTIDGTTYLAYTALGGYPFNADNIKTGIAIAKDGEHFTERHLATPFNAKALTIFPEKAGGKYAALLTVHTDQPPAEICVALADNIEDFWSPNFWEKWYPEWKSHELKLKRSDNDHVEAGSTPILTERGWLIFYSYIENYFGGGPRVFSIEAALLDKDQPTKIIGRSYPLLVPEEIYEEYGVVPDIVFPTGALLEGEYVELWYGATDTVCAKASIKLADLLASLDPEKEARTFQRAKNNPILSPQGDGFESVAVFNAAAFELEGSVHILYRAMDKDHTSTIGYARSKDGIKIDERHPTPAYSPRADFEQKKGGDPHGNSGCEDPRAVVIDGRVHITYTAYDGAHNPRGAVSSIAVEDFLAKRFDKWDAPMLVTPDDVDDKDVGLLPEKVGGNFVLYHRIASRICADLVPDLSFKKRVNRCIEIMGPREGMWDASKVGIAGPPLKVPGGWLLIYHGVSRRSRYRLGAALLAPDGLSVIARTADPVFEATEPYEVSGEVGNVVFSCGQAVKGDTLYLYYGGGDRVLGVATASLKKIVKALS